MGAVREDKYSIEIDALTAAVGDPQPRLVSGTNIKTINGSTILGSGDLVVSGGSGSGITRSIISVAVNTTLAAVALTDYIYIVTALATMTFPTAAGNTNRYTVKNNHSVSITIGTTGGQLIEGATTLTLAASASVDIIGNGSAWSVI